MWKHEVGYQGSQALGRDVTGNTLLVAAQLSAQAFGGLRRRELEHDEDTIGNNPRRFMLKPC
jgi:hypothetical protein